MDTRTFVESKPVGEVEREIRGDLDSLSGLVDQAVGFLRRRYVIFVVVTTAAVGLGLVQLLTSPAEYTAHAVLLLESSKLRVMQQQQVSFAEVPLDTAQLESQVENLKSDIIGLSVVKQMRLAEDPEFVGSNTKSWWPVFGGTSVLTDKPPERSKSELTKRALDTFLRRRQINRIGRTYVLDIAFTSLSPKRAAEIANAIAEAYFLDQLNARYEATRRASTWLQERIAELREQVSALDSAVLDYKEKNKIVDVAVSSAPGSRIGSTRPLEEQQLAELSTQVSTARAASTEAKAKLDRIQEVIKLDIPDASVVESLRSEIVIRLRNQYLDLAAREASLSSRYGSDHLAAANLRSQMSQIRQSVVEELRRIAESAKSDYEIARDREESIKKKLADVVNDMRVTARERVGLRELESKAQAYHAIYDSFLERYTEATQQQSFPISESRVISPAAAPSFKSSPNASVALGGSLVLGLFLSLVIAIMREAFDRVFRTTRQVNEILQTNCLAVLPLLEGSQRPRSTGWLQRFRTKLHSKSKRSRGNPSKPEDVLHRVVSEPLSPFAESFRSIKVAVDIGMTDRKSKIIGVTSTLAREGKSTIASNLAEMIAHVGQTVILIDGDLRNPSMSRARTRDAGAGLIEVLTGKVDLKDAVRIAAANGPAFLPTVFGPRAVHSSELLGSDALRRLIETLQETYDYIIIDLPPIGPVAEVRSSACFVDAYIYVVEWGQTRLSAVRQQLAAAPEIRERLLGGVLNKVDLRAIRNYEQLSTGYYQREIS